MKVRACALLLGFHLAVGLVVASFAPAVAAAEKKDQQKVSEKVGKPLAAALEAAKSKQFDVAMSKIKDAEAVEKKTPFEQFKINEILAFIYANQKKYLDLAAIYEKNLDTPQFLPPEQADTLPKTIAQIYYQAQQYPKSIEYNKRWLKSHPNDTEMLGLLGQTYYLVKDMKQCKDAMGSAVSTAEKAGEEPKEVWLQVAQACAVGLGDEDAITSAYEKLIRYHPKADYWDRYLKRVSRNERSDAVMFQWFRLMNDVGVLKEAPEYVEYAQLALVTFAMPGEAARVVEKGFSTGTLGSIEKDKARQQNLLEKAEAAAKKDKATIPQLIPEAEKATNGGADVGLGLAYFSFEQYDQAIQSLERGLKKGGVKDEATARLTLGIAQFKKGQRDQARASFHAIPKNSPLAPVVAAWILRSYN